MKPAFSPSIESEVLSRDAIASCNREARAGFAVAAGERNENDWASPRLITKKSKGKSINAVAASLTTESKASKNINAGMKSDTATALNAHFESAKPTGVVEAPPDLPPNGEASPTKVQETVDVTNAQGLKDIEIVKEQARSMNAALIGQVQQLMKEKQEDAAASKQSIDALQADLSVALSDNISLKNEVHYAKRNRDKEVTRLKEQLVEKVNEIKKFKATTAKIRKQFKDSETKLAKVRTAKKNIEKAATEHKKELGDVEASRDFWMQKCLKREQEIAELKKKIYKADDGQLRDNCSSPVDESTGKLEQKNQWSLKRSVFPCSKRGAHNAKGATTCTCVQCQNFLEGKEKLECGTESPDRQSTRPRHSSRYHKCFRGAQENTPDQFWEMSFIDSQKRKLYEALQAGGEIEDHEESDLEAGMTFDDAQPSSAEAQSN